MFKINSLVKFLLFIQIIALPCNATKLTLQIKGSWDSQYFSGNIPCKLTSLDPGTQGETHENKAVKIPCIKNGDVQLTEVVTVFDDIKYIKSRFEYDLESFYQPKQNGEVTIDLPSSQLSNMEKPISEVRIVLSRIPGIPIKLTGGAYKSELQYH